MIPRLHIRAHTPQGPLAEALGRPVSAAEGLTDHTIVAHWPGLDYYTLDDEQKIWTSVQWAEHLEDPYMEHPFAASPEDDRHAIFHLDVRLHPNDRELAGPEWAEAAHRLARAAGIEVPGDERGCRWIAVQAQSGRLDLIANLIRLDGTWNTPPANALRRLSDEARRVERDLCLTPVQATRQPLAGARHVPTDSAQLATILSQLADEQAGPLAWVRDLVEHTARQIARQPSAADAPMLRRLESVVRRLRLAQQDLDTTAAQLRAAALPRVAAAPPTAKRSAHRSP